MILVDALRKYPPEMTRGLPSDTWCHMVSDQDEHELHAFAAEIGLHRAWAQLRPKASAAHYDLTPSRRARAVKLGAVEVSAAELVERNFDGLVRRDIRAPSSRFAQYGQQMLALAAEHVTAGELPVVIAAGRGDLDALELLARTARSQPASERSEFYTALTPEVVLDMVARLHASERKRPYKPDAQRVEAGDFTRAGGDALCASCGFTYFDHAPVQGIPWLHRLCNGRLVKL